MKKFNELSKNQKIIFFISIAVLIVGITLAIVLPLTIGRPSVPNTDYDLVKTTKMNNFTYLNQRAEHNQVVLIGDSITEIYNHHDLFAQYTKDSGKLVYNRGISGDTSDKMLARLYDNALNINPSHIVMLIGTNDIGKGIDNDTIYSNISKSIDLTREKCPNAKIILQSVYPVNYSMSTQSRSMVGSRKNSTIDSLNIRLRELSAEKNITWVDLKSTLSDANGNFKEEYTYDGLHPNAVGFNAVTEVLIPLLS